MQSNRLLNLDNLVSISNDLKKLIDPSRKWLKKYAPKNWNISPPPKATRQQVETFIGPAQTLQLNIKLFNPDKATSHDITVIIDRLKVIQILHDTQPGRVITPPEKSPMFHDQGMTIKEKRTASKNDRTFKWSGELPGQHRHRAYGDFLLWSAFHEDKEVVGKIILAIRELSALKLEKIKQENEKGDADREEARIKSEQTELAIKLKREQEVQWKKDIETYQSYDPCHQLLNNTRSILEQLGPNKKLKGLRHEVSALAAEVINYNQHDNTPELRDDKISQNAPFAMRLKLILIDAYIKDKQKPEDKRQLAALKNLLEAEGLLDGDTFKQETREKMKAEFPFSFTYQHLRNYLNSFETKYDKRWVYSAIEKAIHSRKNEPKKNEKDKLALMKQAVVKAYYTSRTGRTIEGRLAGSRLFGDKLKNFIIDPAGLNLIEEYGIKIPHKIKLGDAAPVLEEEIKKKQKKVAVVDFGALFSNLVINDKLLNKLKLEYDEFILVAAEGKDEFNKALIVNLEKQGFSVRLSTPDIDIQAENPGRTVEFSHFKDSIRNIVDVANSNSLDKSLPSPAFYYINSENTECYHFTQNDFEHFKDETEIDPDKAYNYFEERPSDYTELDVELRKYITQREIKKSMDNSNYHSFFSRFVGGISAELKISAAERLIKAINCERLGQELSFKFDDNDIDALVSDSLGKLLTRYQDKVPETFKDAVKNRSIALRGIIKDSKP